MSIEKRSQWKQIYSLYEGRQASSYLFCPGCGNGSIMNAFFKGMEEAEMDF